MPIRSARACTTRVTGMVTAVPLLGVDHDAGGVGVGRKPRGVDADVEVRRRGGGEAPFKSSRSARWSCLG